MIPAGSSGWLLYRADEIRTVDELANFGQVVRVERVGDEIELTVRFSSRDVTARLGPETQVLARKPRSASAPTVAQFSAARSGAMSPVVMPPFTGGRLIGDPLARPA